MTSKEMIKNKIDMLITALYINGDADIETIDKIKDELNMYKNIEKDLERLEKQDKILEILKPYFKGAIFPSAIQFNFSAEEFKKIKEALDNEWSTCIK